jgi:hypothetical protein
MLTEENLVQHYVGNREPQATSIPVEPLVDERARLWIGGIPFRKTMLGAEVTQDRVRLGRLQTVVDQHRRLVVRIDRPKFCRHVFACRQVHRLQFIGQPGFFHQCNNTANIWGKREVV